MRLQDFPRPSEDNGRGLHWSPSPYHPTGSALDFWIDELHAMHIKWLKLLDDGHGSAVEISRRLIAEGIMPIVRLERTGPLPHRLTPEEQDAIRRLIDVGVRYVELEKEPDLPYEWGGELPPDWFEQIIDAFIADADVVIELGGLPAIPAMSLDPARNPIRAIVKRGREDLFQKGVWWAIHTYTLNRPLDYPSDPVNQEGRPVTPEEYQRHYPWGWNEPIELINQWRAEGQQPGATVADDPHCFRGYELAGVMSYEVLGDYIPVISTEGGAVTGWRDDRRYPRLNPWTAAQWTEDINRFLQEQAPPWYFTLCHWLLADRRIDPSRPHAWESHCWYTHYWDTQFGFNGVLPVVERVKAMPSHPRTWPSGDKKSEETMSQRVRLMGDVRDAEGHPIPHVRLIVREDDQDVTQTTTDEEGRFDVTLPRSGTYTLVVEGRGPLATLFLEAGPVQQVNLIMETPPVETPPASAQTPTSQAEPEVGASATAAATTEATPATDAESAGKPTQRRESIIQGRMPGARPGLELLLKNDRGQTWEQTLKEDRRFTFTHLPPGVYHLTLKGVGTVVDNVVLDGTNKVNIYFPMQGILQGWVLGASEETEVTLSSDTYEWTRSITLSPQGQFRFTELPPGTYYVKVEETVLGPIELDGTSVETLDVLDLRPPHRAGITGRIRDADGMVLPEVRVHLLQMGHVVAAGETALNGSYRFENLPEGEYQLMVLAPEGDVVRTVQLKQDETITVDVTLPPPAAPEKETPPQEEKGEEAVPSPAPEEGSPAPQEETQPASVTAAAEQEAAGPEAEKSPPPPAEEETQIAAAPPPEEVSTAPPTEPEAPAEHVEPVAPSPQSEPLIAQEGTPVGTEEISRQPEEETAPKAEATQEPVEPTEHEEAPLEGEQPTMPSHIQPLDIYVLLPPPEHPLAHPIILAALPYLRRSRATAGFSVAEAGRARRVLIVGSEHTYGPEVEAALREAGCEVDRVGEDVATLVALFRASARIYDEGA